MNTQVNWGKIRSEFTRLADVDKLKTEVQRIGKEIRNFDLHTVLSPAAQSKVKTFEKRYTELMRTIHQAQRQVDREFNRILRQIQTHRSDVTKSFTSQKNKLEKASSDLRRRFSKKAASAPMRRAKAPSRTTRKTSAKTTARKRRQG